MSSRSKRSADRALALAIEFGDSDLEIRALVDSGLALVPQGRTREGFGRLDEAMAAISAGGVDPLVAGKSFCAMLSACDRAGELERASEWTRIVTESVLEPNGGRPRVLHMHCREAYGSVLCTVGRWDDGEAAILEALGPDGSQSIGHRIEAMTATQTSITVQWSAPQYAGSGLLQKYTLQKEDTVGSGTYTDIFTTTDTTTTSYTVTGLTASQTFGFKVAAWNDFNGKGDYSTAAMLSTLAPAAAPPNAPAAPTFTSATVTSITLSWTAPATNGAAINGYTVEIAPQATGVYRNTRFRCDWMAPCR